MSMCFNVCVDMAMSPPVRCNWTDRQAGGRLASAATRPSRHTTRQGAAYRSTHTAYTQWALSPSHHAPAAAAMRNIHTGTKGRETGGGGGRPGRWGQTKGFKKVGLKWQKQREIITCDKLERAGIFALSVSTFILIFMIKKTPNTFQRKMKLVINSFHFKIISKLLHFYLIYCNNEN